MFLTPSTRRCFGVNEHKPNHWRKGKGNQLKGHGRRMYVFMGRGSFGKSGGGGGGGGGSGGSSGGKSGGSSGGSSKKSTQGGSVCSVTDFILKNVS